tara:strand:+ start:646 stop:903 length:258 start_codon:yes stop_codon:yes gene_type:complete
MSNLYPAQFEEYFSVEGFTEGFVVQFRDVPEAITQGDTFIEAVEMAQDCLSLALFGYKEEGRAYPVPSAPQTGDVMIDINSEVTK